MQQPPLRSDGLPERQTLDELTAVEALLNRFRLFEREQEQEAAAITQALERFKVELPARQDEEERWERTTAPHFNIFHVLSVERRETKLHSRFLAELLDPRGRHSQGHRFLVQFLETARGCGLSCPPKWSSSDQWQVATEVHTEYGRLDILLRSPADKFIAVIENKVDALEQDQQLSRYDEWLRGQPEEFRSLIFLTPDGREPQSIGAGKCICLSYHDTIKEWLERATSELQSEAHPESLVSAIKQYLVVIKNL
jgi:PD-(D/E)XK nuclease superfamily